MTEHEPGFATRAIHGAVTPPIDQAAPSAPIYQTATYRFDTSEDYAETIAFRTRRLHVHAGVRQPDRRGLRGADRRAGGDRGRLRLRVSGMAAIHTVVTSMVRPGDRIVAGSQLYGGAFHLFTEVLPRFGVRADLVDPHDLEAVRAALPGAALLYLETITNPNAMSVADLPALGRLAADAGVPAAVDNTFASPYLCNPARVRVRVRDALRHEVPGRPPRHDRAASCAAAPRTATPARDRHRHRRHHGAVRGVAGHARHHDLADPDGPHAANALALASYLEAHPKVARVHYPGLASHPDHAVAERVLRGAGGMLALEVDGGVEAGMRVCDALELAWVATSLGGTHTLVGHAASTTHRQMDPDVRRAAGIADGLIRVSVGLEDVEDLIEDFDRALEKA